MTEQSIEEETEYEIVWTLRRRRPEDVDFIDIGFGATSGWTTPDQCGHIALSDIQNYGWETEGDMPDPQEIREAIEGHGHDRAEHRRRSTRRRREAVPA